LADVIGYEGELVFDTSKPDGPPRKALDCSRLAGLGWKPAYDLPSGLKQTYDWYCTEFAGAESNVGAA
jgi:GDP-L-fucose synthase